MTLTETQIAGIIAAAAVVLFYLVYRRLSWRNRRRAVLLLFCVLTAGGGFYFARINPITNKINLGLDLQGGTHVVLEAVDTPDAPVDEIAIQKAVDIIRDRIDRLGVSEPLIQRASDRRIVVELPGVKNAAEALEVIGRTALLEFVDETGNVVFTGRDLAKADVGTKPGTNEPVVVLELKPEGAQKFAQATEKNVGKQIIIMLDKEIISAPSVKEPITGGKAIIEGYETVESAYALAVMLSSGALPVKLDVIENRTVSATLGRDSIEKSKTAGLYGALAVIAFMVLYYRLPGVVASYSLGVYIFLLLGAFWALKATLTLPGIAGIILSIGMAVDANVIVFERVREEIKTGRTLRSAIDAGFTNAMRTVLDSNITTLIAAAVLFYLGTGPVRGFAVTLTLGILASLFTAVMITRWMLKLSVDSGLLPADASIFRR
jgi:preprotein translocase subunit SecD